MSGVVLIAAARPGWGDPEELEPLWELRDTPSTLLVRVASSGCTREQDFRIDLVDGPVGAPVRVRIIRLRPDACKKREPRGTLLKFEKSSLGLPADAPFVVSNAFALPPDAREP